MTFALGVSLAQTYAVGAEMAGRESCFGDAIANQNEATSFPTMG